MTTEWLTESKATILALSEHQAEELNRIGRETASTAQWWGADEDTEDSPDRSIVRCNRRPDGRYRVRVSDAVGAIGLGDLQLIIEPKIPLAHLLYLLAESNQIPRSLFERLSLGVDDTFLTVIARWFVHTCEILLRHGLVSDYGRVTSDLACARGRIHPVATARSVLAGRPVIRCDYDRFGEDTSLNRVLKTAASRLLGWPGLPFDLQRRCRRIRHRFSDCGELRRSDLAVRPDALTRRYRDVHPLALAILAGTGLTLQEGARPTWTFLFRTPEAVEQGVRAALRTHLHPAWPVSNAPKTLLGDRNRSLNPDLVFGDDAAVGDVKYRLTDNGEIARSHLNQIITFATGYRTRKATVIAFGSPAVGEQVHVGPVQINGFNWDTHAATPEQAAQSLGTRIARWLNAHCG